MKEQELTKEELKEFEEETSIPEEPELTKEELKEFEEETSIPEEPEQFEIKTVNEK